MNQEASKQDEVDGMKKVTIKVICNEEDTDAQARVIADDEWVLHYTEQRSGCVYRQVGWL